MKTRILLMSLMCVVLGAMALSDGDDEGPAVGVVRWEPGERRDATDYDKTDYWSAIAFFPKTGKFGAACEWTNQDNASRVARENCNAPDARAVVLCCNGWCAMARGDPPAKGDWAWGVGSAPGQERAEQIALEKARARDKNAKVVYSIFARQMVFKGVVAYSPVTGDSGYSSGFGRSDTARAVKFSDDPNARVFVSPNACVWMAVARGDDKSIFGFGWAGNRVDAEKNASDECLKRGGKTAKVVLSFCTNGVTPESKSASASAKVRPQPEATPTTGPASAPD
jgi:hypothetical protein